ncbi:MAG: 3-deoxy-D-manno-octulosonic acid transferase [Pseudomonadota bacterium]
MSLALGLYRLGTTLLEPFTPAILRARARRGKEDPTRLGERLGRASRARPDGPLVWIHAVSVGESQSVLPLIERLRVRRPDVTVLVTTGTATSAALMAKRLPEGAIHQYAPLDTPGASRRFLDHWRPDAGIFVESELWPNLILGADDRGARLLLLSARVTERTERGWAKAPGLARRVLLAFDAVAPQDEATAARLARYGATPGARINLKYVGRPLACDEAELARLREEIAGRPVVLAASTHPGEEALIADAVRAGAPAGTLLIVAPRHPERGDDVAAVLGASVARRSRRGVVDAGAAAYLADTLGEMGLWFRLADVVIMGGSFVPGIGGHNPLEPARLGAAIVTGPHIANARDACDEMRERSAILIADDAGALGPLVGWLLAHPERRAALGEQARAFADAKAEALEDAWRVVEAVLP